MTLDEIKSLLSYEPETGVFRWAVGRPGCRVGDVCGSDKRGYRVLTLKKKKYFAHRVAWLFVYGEWPSDEIDHANCLKGDNRIVNLRVANRSQNASNVRMLVTNTSGAKGVCFDKSRQNWIASISENGKTRKLGRFNSKEDAAAAYAAAAVNLRGQFARL